MHARLLYIGIICGLAACGGSGISIDTNADNVCSEIAEVACHNLYQCCAEGEIENFLGVQDPRTEVQCRDDVRRICDRQLAQRDASITAGRSAFDSDIMNGCLDALIAPDGLCADISDALPWTEACMNDAWVGQVADGGECFQPFECASSDSFCAATQRCTALPKLGEPCTGQCANGLFCSGVCEQQLGAGAMCTSSIQCQDELFCDTAATVPTCTALGEGGDSCKSNQACKSFQCIPGTCMGTNQNCFTDANCSGQCSDGSGFCSQDFELLDRCLQHHDWHLVHDRRPVPDRRDLRVPGHVRPGYLPRPAGVHGQPGRDRLLHRRAVRSAIPLIRPRPGLTDRKHGRNIGRVTIHGCRVRNRVTSQSFASITAVIEVSTASCA